MTLAHDYRKLDVWRRSHALTLTVYRLTRDFPREERFGISTQLRRACCAIPTNLVEGMERTGPRAFAAFVDIAAASAAETDYLVMLAGELGYMTPNQIAPLREELMQLRRMLTSLRNALRSRSRHIS